jgi:phosphate transport system permease protein
MALSLHLFTISTQVPDVTEGIPYGTAIVLVGSVLLVNAAAIVLRVYLRTRKKW